MAIKQLKIGIDVTGIHRVEKTGTETFIYNLIENLKLDRNNKYVLYSYYDLAPDFILPDNFSIRICKLKPSVGRDILMFLFWKVLSLPIMIAKDKLDIFLSTNQMGPLFCTTNLFTVIHDLSFLTQQECFNFKDRLIFKFFARLTILKSKKIFADSIATKNDLIKFYNVSHEKINVVYLGYDKNKFCLQKKSEIIRLKQKYNIDSEYMLFVGTLQKRKNIRNLILAFDLLKKKYEINEKLVIAGKKGWLYQDIFATIMEKKLENDVIFTDYVSKDDISPLLAGAKVFVLPSLYEGFGIPILESMATGTPVVASNISSLPEVTSDAAVLINNPNSVEEIAEKIKLIITDNNLRNDFSKRGLKRVNYFSWKKMSDEYLKVFNNYIR